MSTVHIPILAKEIIEGLLPAFEAGAETGEDFYYLDCTFGGGGHTSFVLELFQNIPHFKKGKVIAIDQDEDAVARGHVRFENHIKSHQLEIIHSKMSEIPNEYLEKPVFGVLADLGFSSDQIEDRTRGLSFQNPGPLDMRLDPSGGPTLLELLRKVREKELADIIFEYGEERFSRKIAASLSQARDQGRIPKDTLELAELIRRSVPPAARHGRIHPATRTFQALRIWVNHELEELDSFLSRVILSVRPKGRACVLSFHSLEDRKVKLAFREREKFEVITKKPLEADENEVNSNPRARSAKLRIAERI